MIEEGWLYDLPDAQTTQELAQIAETARNLAEAGLDGFEEAFKKGYLETQTTLNNDPEARQRAAHFRHQAKMGSDPEP